MSTSEPEPYYTAEITITRITQGMARRGYNGTEKEWVNDSVQLVSYTLRAGSHAEIIERATLALELTANPDC
jgi:hypothetical protein